MLLGKVVFEIQDPVGARFWDILAERVPERRDDFMALKASYQFLNQLRDVYRLTVVPSNDLDPVYFAKPAAILGYQPTEERSAREPLEADLRRHCQRAAEKLEALVLDLLAE